MLDQRPPAMSICPLAPVSPSMYAISPLAPTQVTMRPVHFSCEQDITFLIPAGLPLETLLADADFVEGCECGYEWWSEEDEQRDWTVPRVVNEVYQGLYTAFDPCLYLAMAGFALGTLNRLAHTRPLLALVGLAHLGYLLSLLPLDAACWPKGLAYTVLHVRALHSRAVGAFRARVRAYREQGLSFAQAQYLALAFGATQGCRETERTSCS